MKKIFKKGGRVIIALLFVGTLTATTTSTQPSIFDLMHHQEVLEVTLETDIELLKSDRALEQSLPARLSFVDATGKEQYWRLKVEQRGRFRRMTCSDVPPLKLKFKKADLHIAGLAKFNDMKLVTQCVKDKAEAQILLKKEFLGYKLYNELSPNSFRVQLLRITYKDTNTKKKRKQWAFLIEDTAQLRARMGAEKCEGCYNLSPDRFDADELQQLALFQYMIGNADWSLKHLRNVKLMRKEGRIIVVPYDFDFSGLVAAPYAIPSPDLGQRSIRQRLYLGFEEDPKELEAGLSVLKGKKKQLLDLLKSQRYLSIVHRREVKDYLKEFFDGTTIEWPMGQGANSVRSVVEAE
ncbi:MAG: hypothetical protein AAGG75_00155 [Bacteroidota bacterium]